MKNISTSIKQTSVTTQELKADKPARRTLEFLRQFARAYAPVPLPATPGIVLN
ncbi:MAG: hypothetical protein HDS69_03900 [Bacteroidales bacterium]|nr:hypothetical protein [Bacteroidales bacterium]MBD5229164.1 hypothetical protein [Bacteroidales bacterium]MBD5235417.1 hypothetical protein [Barnesiella sp.]MBD5248307.1 hypothetical protein [Barnesiella sp.]MBD5259041.1 hypothetical protein [Barnesiella sp.]